MHAFPEFKGMDASFWALIKLISESLGYTNRKTKLIRTYSIEEISQLLISHNITVKDTAISMAKDYCDKRANTLNEFARTMLMDATEAEDAFKFIYPVYIDNKFMCKLPMNKQRGEMKKINYFTAIINILTEQTIRKSFPYNSPPGFDDDPRGLVYVLDNDNRLIGASSRRYDGAYPSIMNPKIVWEIKEYYYNTTFGSRVSDGVYETQLDGHEFRDIAARSGRYIFHVFFIDAYKTWWIDGKSYLCRIIDALNSGLVDEVIIGREVFKRWPELLSSILDD